MRVELKHKLRAGGTEDAKKWAEMVRKSACIDSEVAKRSRYYFREA